MERVGLLFHCCPVVFTCRTPVSFDFYLLLQLDNYYLIYHQGYYSSICVCYVSAPSKAPRVNRDEYIVSST